MAKGCLPAKTWSKFPIEIECYCCKFNNWFDFIYPVINMYMTFLFILATLEAARRKAEHDDYTSSEERGRGKRVSNVVYYKNRSENSDDSESMRNNVIVNSPIPELDVNINSSFDRLVK